MQRFLEGASHGHAGAPRRGRSRRRQDLPLAGGGRFRAVRPAIRSSPRGPPRPRRASPTPRSGTSSAPTRRCWRSSPARSAVRWRSPSSSPSATEEPDQRAVSLAALAAVRVLAREAPLVIAVDDVQWLDPSSAAVLGFAARRLRDEPVGLLVAQRTAGEAPAPLDLDRAPAGRSPRPPRPRPAEPRRRPAAPAPAARLGPLAPGAPARPRALGREPVLRPRAREGGAGGNAPPAARRAAPGDARGARRRPSARPLARDPPRPRGGGGDAASPPWRWWTPSPGPARSPPPRTCRSSTSATAWSASPTRCSPPAPTPRRTRRRGAPCTPRSPSGPASRRSARCTSPSPRPVRTRRSPAPWTTPDAERCRAARRRPRPSCTSERSSLTPPGGSAAVARRRTDAATCAFLSGDSRRARGLLAEVLRTTGRGPARARALVRLALVRGYDDDLRAAEGLLREAIENAGGDAELTAEAHLQLAGMLFRLRERLREAVEHATAAAASERGRCPRRGGRRPAAARGGPRRPARRRRRCSGSLELDARGRHARAIARPLFQAAFTWLWWDELERARTAFETLRAHAAELGDESSLAYVLVLGAQIDCVRGDVTGARRHADEGLALTEQTGQATVGAYLLALRALADAIAGELDAWAGARRAGARRRGPDERPPRRAFRAGGARPARAFGRPARRGRAGARAAGRSSCAPSRSSSRAPRASCPTTSRR